MPCPFKRAFQKKKSASKRKTRHDVASENPRTLPKERHAMALYLARLAFGSMGKQGCAVRVPSSFGVESKTKIKTTCFPFMIKQNMAHTRKFMRINLEEGSCWFPFGGTNFCYSKGRTGAPLRYIMRDSCVFSQIRGSLRKVGYLSLAVPNSPLSVHASFRRLTSYRVVLVPAVSVVCFRFSWKVS